MAVPAMAEVTPVAGVTIHSADEVSARFITRSSHGLVFHCPLGGDWDLVETPAELGNTTGDGSFHAMQAEDVADALRGLAFPLDGQDFHIYILPYPRRADAGSCATGRAMFLSPGIREYSVRETQFVATHETGHLVQYAWMPDGDTELWSRYRALRGIADAAVFNPGAAHENRPHEIFAEDFRFLFGDGAANYSGSIENSNLALPSSRPELKKFFAALRGQGPGVPSQLISLTNGPNPFVSGTVLSFALTKTSESDGESQSVLAAAGASMPVTVEVYSSEGRRVRKLVDAQYVSGSYRVPFDALDDAGQPLSRGVYFARLQAGGSVVNRKLVLTR